MREKSCQFIERVTENERIKEVSYVEHLQLKKTSLNTILFLAYGETLRKKCKGRNFSGRKSVSSRWVVYENLAGNGYVESRGNKYPVRVGDVILLQPMADVAIRQEEDQTLFGRYICIYDTIVMAAMGNSLSVKAAGIFHVQEEKEIHELFDRIKNIVTGSSPSPEAERELSMICYEILYILASCKKEESSDPKFEHFLRQLSATCAQAHTLSSMANTCGVTPRTLIRLFHAKLSVSPIQYLINLRLDYAAMLLRRGDQTYTVKSIAEKCGYRNGPFFSREFRKKFSLSPLEYMKKYRQEFLP